MTVSVAGVMVPVVVCVVVGVVQSQLVKDPSMNRETALLRSLASLSQFASFRNSPNSPHVNVPLWKANVRSTVLTLAAMDVHAVPAAKDGNPGAVIALRLALMREQVNDVGSTGHVAVSALSVAA